MNDEYAMMNDEYAMMTSSAVHVSNMKNINNIKANNNSKYVFTQTRSPAKNIYPTSTSPRLITSLGK